MHSLTVSVLDFFCHENFRFFPFILSWQGIHDDLVVIRVQLICSFNGFRIFFAREKGSRVLPRTISGTVWLFQYLFEILSNYVWNFFPGKWNSFVKNISWNLNFFLLLIFIELRNEKNCVVRWEFVEFLLLLATF